MDPLRPCRSRAETAVTLVRNTHSGGLKIRRGRSSQDPDFLENLATSLQNCGVLEETRGNIAGARAFYEDALENWRARIEAEPPAIVDLTVQQLKLSYFLATKAGDRSTGLVLAQDAERNIQRVARFDPAKGRECDAFLLQVRTAGESAR